MLMRAGLAGFGGRGAGGCAGFAVGWAGAYLLAALGLEFSAWKTPSRP